MKEFNYNVLPRGTLAGAMNGTQLSFSLGAGQGASWPTGKCLATISEGNLTTDPTLAQLAVAETVEVESRSGDSFTLIERDVNGQASPLTHDSGHLVQMVLSPADLSNIHGRMTALEQMLARVIGNVTTGVKASYPNYDELQVVEQGSPDMTVLVKAGSCMVSRVMCYLASDFTTPTITAPSSNNRIDLISIDSLRDTITVTTGTESGSPSAPSTPANHLALATILLTTTHTQIVTGDITDVRVTL